jgi:succinate dehydrogenase / fumarate reductase, iron-sulfur subunit
MTNLLACSILRFDPATATRPTLQAYTVDLTHCRGKMVLDVLIALKATEDSLTFRRSCAEGVCGSCAMNINGKNRLACITPIRIFKHKKLTIRPLPGMPIIRDLVVDLSQFYEHYERIEPFLKTTTPPPKTERLQSKAQRKKLDGLYECILCACCTTACPSAWWNPDTFIGPAASLQAARFIADSRDEATEERYAQLSDANTLLRCRNIMNCVDVCPKGLNPTQAIGAVRRGLL